MTTATTFKPTLMQRLLGRNYKWWYVVKYYFNLSLAYRVTAFFIIIRDLVPVFISLAIYGSVSEYNNYLSYILLGNIFLKVVVWLADISWEISFDIRHGGVSSKLLRPSSWLKTEFFAVIGGNFYTFLVNIAILYFLIFSNGFNIQINWSLILSLLLVVCVASPIYYFIDLLVALVAFWTPETNTLIELKSVATPFLAGALVIFDINQRLNFLKFLPWSFITYHPMQIYLGKYSPTEIDKYIAFY